MHHASLDLEMELYGLSHAHFPNKKMPVKTDLSGESGNNREDCPFCLHDFSVK